MLPGAARAASDDTLAVECRHSLVNAGSGCGRRPFGTTEHASIFADESCKMKVSAGLATHPLSGHIWRNVRPRDASATFVM